MFMAAGLDVTVAGTISKSSDGFAWVQGPLGRTLVAHALAPAHAWFTTRDLPLAPDADGAGGWSRICDEMGVPSIRLLRLTQVHGAKVVTHFRGATLSAGRPPADAAATDDPDVGLAVQTADCVPLLISDTDGRAVAAVHAGWRGTVAGAARAAVETLQTEFGVSPDRMIAAIGPSIGPCCYRVGAAVERSFREAGYGPEAIERWFVRSSGHLTLDLWQANRDHLAECGVGLHHVHVARLCTACHPELFHSYRRDGAGTGRMAAIVRL
jgi:YfiH family protein